MKNDLILAIDFDGTIVEHEFPNIGKPLPLAFDTLKKLKLNGVQLILSTMRSDKDGGTYLTDAVDFCKDNGLVFDSINENPQQKSWTDSPKIFAHHYIGDDAAGCPLVYENNKKPYVKWSEILIWLYKFFPESLR